MGGDSGSGVVDGGNPSAASGGARGVDGSAAPGTEAGVADSGGMIRNDAETGGIRDGGFADGAGDAATAGDAVSEGGSTQGGGIFTLASPAFDNRTGCSQNTAASCAPFPEENIS